jgi:PKHD-type hydroxylase
VPNQERPAAFDELGEQGDIPGEELREFYAVTGVPLDLAETGDDPLAFVDKDSLAKVERFGVGPEVLADPTQYGGTAPFGWRAPLSLVPGAPLVPHAHYCYYEPGRHRLAFSAEECDRVLELMAAAEADGVVMPSTGIKKTHLAMNEQSGWIYRRVVAILHLANATWWRFDFDTLDELEVSRYDPHQDPSGRAEAVGAHWHLDVMMSGDAWTRKFTLLVQLSDPADYVGGDVELFFRADPVRWPRARGLVFVFPSFTLHRVTDVTAGVRFGLTASVQGPPLR